MDKELKHIVEVYNKRQDKYEIAKIYQAKDGTYLVWMNDAEYDIGIYEWLFNPKYEAFEVFGIELVSDIIYSNYKENGKLFARFDSKEEIIEFLYKELAND